MLSLAATQSCAEQYIKRAKKAVLYLIAVLGVLCIGSGLAATESKETILVFAAASQRDALDAAIAVYNNSGGDLTINVSYQSTSTLARQIEQGAPADLFIAANPIWMDILRDRNLIDKSTRINLFGNRLLLVTSKGNQADAVDIDKNFNIAGLLKGGRLAVGDSDHVPAGLYAKEALQNLGLWKQVESKLARADNVRVALALVARGEAPLGIVYASDAVADKSVRTVGYFPENSHSKIVYPAAIVSGSKKIVKAKAFLDFLHSPEALRIYEKFGFRILTREDYAGTQP